MDSTSEEINLNESASTRVESEFNNIDETNTMTFLDGTFFQPVPEKSVGQRIVAVCTKCLPNHIEIKGFRNCTSNFVTHLKRKHGNDVVEEYRTYIKNRKTCLARPSTSKQACRKSASCSYTQESFDKDLTQYFAHSMIPLRCIENPYFIKIFENLNIEKHGLKMISRRTLRRLLCDYYTTQAQEIKRDLEEAKYVSTTVDIWSGRRRSFIGITVHWIDFINLKIKSRALACRRFMGVHDNQRITELLQKIHAE